MSHFPNIPVNVTVLGTTATQEYAWAWVGGNWSVSIGATEAPDTMAMNIRFPAMMTMEAVEDDDVSGGLNYEGPGWAINTIPLNVSISAQEDDDVSYRLEMTLEPEEEGDDPVTIVMAQGWEVRFPQWYHVHAALPSPLAAPVVLMQTWASCSVTLMSPLADPTVFMGQPVDADILLEHPLGEIAVMLRLPQEVFTPGETYYSQVATLGPRRLLSDPLPLRKASDMGEYRENQYLPHVYGKVAVSPIPLDQKNLRWLLADHHIQRVHQVFFGSTPFSGWDFTNELDATSHPIAVLRLSQPPESGEPVTVIVSGKSNPATGELLTHPIQIVQDIVAMQPGGWGMPREAFYRLLEDYPSVRLGGVINKEMTLRQALDEILLPLGIIWSTSPLLMMREAPFGAASELILDEASAEATHDSLYTVVRLLYSQNYATGRPGRAMKAEAVRERQLYGSLEYTLEAPWVQTMRDAQFVVDHFLKTHARPRWTITGKAPLSETTQLGDTVVVDHPLMPQNEGIVIGKTVNRTQANVDYVVRAWAGEEPKTRRIQDSEGIDKFPGDGLQFVYRDGIVTLTILDDLGNPLANATVTLNGAVTKTTDRTGRVQFEAERGLNTVTVVSAGYAPFEMDLEF